VALSAINNAMEKISAASQTWIDIADAASGLLMYERAEEERQWNQNEAFLRKHIREFGTENLDTSLLAETFGESTMRALTDDVEGSLRSPTQEAPKDEDDRVFKLAPSKLVPQPPIMKKPAADSPKSAPRNQPTFAPDRSGAPRKLNEPAPWKKKDKLHSLLHEQNMDAHQANAQTVKASQVKHQLSAGAQAKKARNRAQRDLEAATRAKPNFPEMIAQQQRELAFVDRMHVKYQKMVANLLEEQEKLQMDLNTNPWDLTLGMVHDTKERHLKRKLLWLVGAAPEPDESAISGRPTGTPDRMITNELDELVQLIDEDGDGLLTNEELEARLAGDANLMLRLQALRINLALSSENTLQGSNSKTRRAMMQLQIKSVHNKLDLDGNGYIDVDELIEVATKRPELKKKLRSLGIHLDAMLRTAKRAGATLGLANQFETSMDALGASLSGAVPSPPVSPLAAGVGELP
jgi:Ca2+-binding EF-hand superfamily protein